MDLSVVVPVYKSQECIEALVKRVGAVLSGTVESFELILVNDCSPDGSWAAITAAAKQYAFVVGVNLRKNFGQDNALMAGLRHSRGGVVVIMDDDLQHDPADIPALFDKVREGHDVCFARFERKKQHLWKNMGSRLNSAVACLIMNKPRNLYLSPFKAIERGVVDEIVRYGGPFTYIDGLILTITSDLVEIPATHGYRFAGRGNYGFVRSFQVWMKLLTSFSVAPLRWITLLGFIVSGFSFLLACYFVAEYCFTGTTIEGWTSLIVGVLFFGGVQLVALGMLGEYVGRNFITVNRRPQYVERETIRGS
jgi:polyisoprenyl-phosphate glycosyltransferase